MKSLFCTILGSLLAVGLHLQENPPDRNITVNQPERCCVCHVDGSAVAPQVDLEELKGSEHATLSCTSCHRGIGLAHGTEVPEVDCNACHLEITEVFERGVHWRELKRRNPDAPNCVGCHGSHGVRPAEDFTSPVNHAHVSSVCGACHQSQLRQFERSSHGLALADAGKREMAPACTTCHGEHVIFAAGAPASPASPGRLPRTCGGCHDDPRLAEVLGIPSERLKSYNATIHGLRNRFGVTTVATCADCHGTHLVLPESNPASTVSQNNLVRTCAGCHPGANENFVKAKIHVQATPESSPGVFAVRWFYIVFISILGTGFVMHIIFDLIKLRRRRRETRDG